jgi:8-oxo-dGTP diphosphatase
LTLRNRTPLLVAAGVIHRNGHILVGQRRKADRHPLKWEFPGGKVESGESPQQALVRELREELEIEAIIGSELARYEHEYTGGSRVHLLFFAVIQFQGQPSPKVFQQISWIDIRSLPALDFLEGDLDFIQRLSRGDFSARLGLQTEPRL